MLPRLGKDISFFKFYKDLKKYNFYKFRKDFIAAFSVALLTIPQSIAYSLLAGLPISAGLFAAIFGCLFVGVFGSSRYLIAGPTTAVAILIQTSISEVIINYYPEISGAAKEQLIFSILSHIVIIMGVLQLLFAFLNMGKILQFVSRSVILGYFVGVIIAIIVNQLYPFFGVEEVYAAKSVVYKLWEFIKNIHNLSIAAIFLGILGVLIIILIKKKASRLPSALIMMLIISFIAFFYQKFLFGKSFFTGDLFKITLLKDLGVGKFPLVNFTMPIFDMKILKTIAPAAVAITLLCILEVFSVSRTLATKSNRNVNTNQEIFAFGLGNTFLAFIFGAMPTSGSISRSLFNYNNRAKTRISIFLSGAFVAIIIFSLWPLVKFIPLVSLAAILLAVVPTLIDYNQLKLCFRVTKGDALAFLLTMASCLFFSLHIAFFIGVGISIASYLKRAAVPHLVEYAFNPRGRLTIVSGKKKARRQVRIIGIAGELFFGSVDLFQNNLQKVAKDPYVKVIILRLNNVYYMDASMCQAILNLSEYLKKKGRYLIISGISEEIWDIFSRAHIIEKIGKGNLFLTNEEKPQLSTWNACARAQDIIQ